jgi:peptidyl-prolyl cis-trans isomerase C
MIRAQGSVCRFRVFALAAVVLPALLLAGCSRDSKPAIAQIGDHRLTVQDFEDYAREPQVMEKYAGLPDSVQKRGLLNDLVDFEVLAEAARRKGLDKDPEYVGLEAKVLPQLLPDALYELKIGRLAKASEDEARLWYQGQTTEYQLGMLMTADSTMMRTLLGRIERGESLAEVAKTGSQDAGSAANGGLLQGWLTLGQLPPDIETAIRPLAKGQHTGPIRQRSGTYVFFVVDTRPHEQAQTFDQQRESIQSLLVNRKRGALADQYLGSLRERYGLVIDGPGWSVIDGVLVTMPDSLKRYLVTDPKRAGLSAEDLALPVARWANQPYTVGQMLADLAATPLQERPPTTRSDLFRSYVEGKAMSDILVREAKKEGLDRSPDIARQVARARSTWLVQHFLTEALPPSALPSPTPAQLDSIVTHMVEQMGGGAPHGRIGFQDLPPQLQQQIVSDWQQSHRQAALKAEVERLKAEIQPRVDEAAFQKVPWPIPAAPEA